jgi:hypothetical protein
MKILGEMWQLSNPPEPRKRGDTARFTIPTPIDSDTNDYLDSASRLVEKLPEHDKLMQQIATIRDRNNQLIRDAKNLYDHYPLNVIRQGEYRVDVIFDNLPAELQFRKLADPLKDRIFEIKQSLDELQKPLIAETEKQHLHRRLPP